MNTLLVKDNETMKSHFPDGLQVLVIDDNIVCLKVLGFLLQKCGYKVTMKRSATEALEMLRKSRDSFDIVITDVMRSDMDGFKFLEIIGLEMDLPVIMTTANGDTRSVVEGIKHGARDYLVKPVQLKDLKNIWQHANRKSNSQDHGNNEKDEAMEECGAKKKCRLNWSRELHAKFLEAYHKLDGDTSDKVVPKRILEIMNEPGLTRENVASHLQKFRSGLKKKKMEKQSQVCSNNTTSCTKTRDNTLCNKTKIAATRSLSCSRMPKPEIPTANFTNQTPLFLNQNQCNFTPHRYLYATQMLDPLLLPGNVPPPPDYPTFTADDCTEMQQLVQTGFPAISPPYSCFSGASYLMPAGDVSSQMSPISDFISAGGNVAGSTTLGHTEGESWVNIRGNQLLEGSAGNIDDDTRFVKLLLQNYSKRQHNNWTSSPNDDDYTGKNIGNQLFLM